MRERRLELAVLKVLGFRPDQILMLVLGEALLLGGRSRAGQRRVDLCGSQLGDGRDFVPHRVLRPLSSFRRGRWWGPAIGARAALVGSFLPAWSARSVKVADVFSKVA